MFKSKLFLVALVGCLVLATGTAFAARSSSSATLNVSWPTAAATTAGASETAYVVSGCGYDASKGGVTIVVQSPTAMAFAGQVPDSNGCISLSNFSTNGSGHYTITAYQSVRNKAVQLASTSFDV
jgi:hypothetical protein